jgi:hypothetical protein
MKMQKENVPFTMIANAVLVRTDISLKAKGIYAYLFSKPDGWVFSADRVAKECKEERKSILSAMRELEGVDLLTRKRNGDGTVEYILAYSIAGSNKKAKVPKGDSGSKATVPKRHSTKRGLVSNKEYINKKDIPEGKPTEGEKEKKFTQLGADLIREMEAVDPKNKKYYNNTSQRDAADFLIDTYGFENVKKVISLLSFYNKRKYAKKTYTPVQLRDNWCAIRDDLIAIKEDTIKKRGTVLV